MLIHLDVMNRCFGQYCAPDEIWLLRTKDQREGFVIGSHSPNVRIVVSL